MVYKMIDIVNYRFKPNGFKSWKYPDGIGISILQKYPSTYSYFWLCIFDNQIKITNNDKCAIFCKSSNVEWFCNNKIIQDRIGDGRVLVIAGGDTLLSKNIIHLKKIQDRYSRIYYEAKDVFDTKIRTMPMGMNCAYILRNGGHDKITKLVNDPSISKTKLVAAAWGSKWKFLDKTKYRKGLIRFCQNKDWLVRSNWAPTEYYEKLSEYKYFICATGAGIQAPKIFEALLTKTVPIVENIPAFVDLKSYGYPILIVNSWNELNPEMLEETYKTNFENVDWNKVHYSLTNEGMYRMFLHEDVYPNLDILD